jgi:hypothetical protein
MHGVKKDADRILVGKPEGKRPLGIYVGGRILLRWIIERYNGAV